MQPGTISGDQKCPAKRPAILSLYVIRWGLKQTPNAMKLDRRSIYTIIRPHTKFQTIPGTFSGHLQNTILDMPRARASVVGLRTDNGRNWGRNPDGCKFQNMMMQCG